jgi:hypothetical protein
MKEKTEIMGLVFGALSVVLFWAPPVGLGFGLAGLIISISQYQSQRRFRKTAIVISSMGILFFVVFWGSIFLASQ